MEETNVMPDPASLFQPLFLPRKRFPEGTALRYRVYESPGDFLMVDAATVAEALERSGIKHPLKVERVIEGSRILYDAMELEAISEEHAGEALPYEEQYDTAQDYDAGHTQWNEQSPTEYAEADMMAEPQEAAEAYDSEPAYDAEASVEEPAQAMPDMPVEPEPEVMPDPDAPLTEDAVNQLLQEGE